MIRKYAPDIATVFLISLMAVVFADEPVMNPYNSQVPKVSIKAPPAELQKESKGINRPIEPDQAMKERNIFVASGTYTEPMGQTSPDNPYTLIAVLQGKERKAVFREYAGSIVTLPVGKILIDGFVISRIDAVSVHLQKRDEKKELRLFNAAGGSPSPAVDKGGALPKNLYTLIGILGDNEKKAVFKDYKGSVSILGVGSKLIDGAVIIAIDSVSVKLKKGNENSELRIFDFQNSEQAVRKKS